MSRDNLETIYRAEKPWHTLYALYSSERRAALVAVFWWFVKASPLWVLPLITANLIDITAHPTARSERFLWLNVAIGAVMILQNVASSALYTTYASRAIRSVENRLRSAMVRRLQILSITYHSHVSTATLQTKVLRDVESVEQISRQIVDTGLNALVTITVALAVTTWRMPAFLPFILLLAPISLAIRRMMSKILQEGNKLVRNNLETMSSQVLGMLSMIPITRAHAQEEAEIARMDHRLERLRNVAHTFDRQVGLMTAIAWATIMLLNLTCMAAAVWVSFHHVLPLTPGDVVLLTGYGSTIMAAVMQFNAMLPVITRGFDALRSIGEVIECPDIEENRGKQPVSAVRGEFRFENTSFQYDASGANGERTAVRDLSFSVRAGETIGIVGSSGSGKSTLMSLIIGFHRPTGGRILLDGVDMNSLDLRTYRQHLALVSQETILFEATVRENIVYGALRITEKELWAAIEAANAADMIRELPMGLDTMLGESGVRMSGGQRQRLAIARALLRNPSVLVLDEATSALDAENEAAVQQALERLSKGRTTFIVSHRPSTLKHAHRVIVLDHGSLVESGAPEEIAALA